jgi:hypothetical protein
VREQAAGQPLVLRHGGLGQLRERVAARHDGVERHADAGAHHDQRGRRRGAPEDGPPAPPPAGPRAVQAVQQPIHRLAQVRGGGIGSQGRDVGLAEGAFLREQRAARGTVGQVRLQLGAQLRPELLVHVREDVRLREVTSHD